MLQIELFVDWLYLKRCVRLGPADLCMPRGKVGREGWMKEINEGKKGRKDGRKEGRKKKEKVTR